MDLLDQHADTGEVLDVFPFIKRCALDVICGRSMIYCLKWIIDSETAMGTNINSQTGGNSEYVDAVVRISDIIFQHIR